MTWFVEALDRSGNVFSSSATSHFKYTLAVPTGLHTSSDAIPTLQWNPMPGAVAYDLDIITPANGNGEITPPSMDTTAYTPTSLKGTGTVHLDGQGGVPDCGRQRNQRSHCRAQLHPDDWRSGGNRQRPHSGARQLIVGWTPKAGAKNYSVQFSTDPRFDSGVFDSTTTDNTSLAPLLTMAPAYVEGGTSYWRVASNDADGNQSRWSAAQTLVMPIQIHLTATGTPFKGKTTTVKVSAKNYGAEGHRGRQRQGLQLWRQGEDR